MAPSLGKYLNKTIMVSIPPLSGDITCRSYKLAGIEIIGLWLEGADLARGFLPEEQKSQAPTTWAFFVPYSQIACIAIGTMPLAVPGSGAAPAAQGQGAALGVSAPAAGKAPPATGTAAQKKERNKER
jgi:hypothetical protein